MSRLKTQLTLARQREGRVISRDSGFRPRSEWVHCEPQKEKVVHDARPRPLNATRNQRALVPRNNERGLQCHGQGKRHQNPAAHVQPRQAAGRRQAKWSNPNPKSHGGATASAAARARRNFKSAL